MLLFYNNQGLRKNKERWEKEDGETKQTNSSFKSLKKTNAVEEKQIRKEFDAMMRIMERNALYGDLIVKWNF